MLSEFVREGMKIEIQFRHIGNPLICWTRQSIIWKKKENIKIFTTWNWSYAKFNNKSWERKSDFESLKIQL